MEKSATNFISMAMWRRKNGELQNRAIVAGNRKFPQTIVMERAKLLFLKLALVCCFQQTTSAALLQATFNPVPAGTNIDLTAEGILDWAHWGLVDTNSFDHKGGVTVQISNAVLFGTNSFQQYSTNLHGYSWSNGAPTIAATNSTTGISVTGLTNGFQITAPANQVVKELKIYLGAYKARGSVQILLNDSSAPGYADNSLDAVDTTNGVYLVRYAAASSNQTIIVRYSVTNLYDSAGFISLQSASLTTNSANIPPTVAIMTPTNNAQFYYPAQITITASASDTDGLVRKVEFFQNNLKLGEKTNAPYTLFWNNVIGGSYALTAVATDDAGATNTSAAINVKVVTNTPPTISITSPVDEQNLFVPGNLPITVSASDAEGLVKKVEFFRDGTKLGESTNVPFDFTWSGASPGIYTLTARATDDAGVTADSAPISVFVTTTGGALSGGIATPPSLVNLTAEGLADWVHWGLFTETTFNHKAGVAQQISNFSIIGPDNTAYQYGDNANGYGWNDGTPTAVVTNTVTGVYVVGLNNGFLVTAPADTSLKTLKLYVGAFAARGKFRAYLSDFTAPVYTDSSLDNTGNGNSTSYSLTYAAATSNQTLVVRYTVGLSHDPSANVTLQAATLVTANALPTVGITGPTNNSSFIGPTNITITAAATDSDGTITRVEFFNGASKLGEITNSPFTFLWTNVALGSYTLTARATDNQGATFTSPSANVFVGMGGGLLRGRFASAPATVNLSTEGTTDWTHWGLDNANSLDRKTGVAAKISAVTIMGGNPKNQYTDSVVLNSWSDGDPTLAASTRTGIFVYGLTNGYQITAPADVTRRRLKVYVGVFAAQGKFQASLNDFSAPPYSDTSVLSVGGNRAVVYCIDYAAASAGKFLTIQYTAKTVFDPAFGNVTLQAATLGTNQPPQLVNPRITGDSFLSSFPSESGYGYVVEFTDSLLSPNWQPLQNLVGNGANLSLADSNAPVFPSRFYRLKVQ